MAATMQDPKLGYHIFLTPRVPQGLAAAVEGLTREVIRHRPENIYIFAAHHFEKLLRLREQYDDSPVNKKSMKILHDMNETIKERHIYLESKEANNFVQHSGWSLNETAKVLERYRSIFGENNQKISTEEVRELANEPVLTTSKIQESSPKQIKENASLENTNITGKYAVASSSKKRESPRITSQDWHAVSKNDFKNTPKIISQIPLAKDIKTELKRNRISSRERKKGDEKRIQVACEYSRETTVEKLSRKSVEKTKRNYETRTEQRKSLRTENSIKKKTDLKKDNIDSPKLKKSSRSLSMDHVKNYVVQNFVGMTSLDELQTPSYVEKVQEVIDETSMIIKEKVEALKTGVVKASKTKQSKKERSLSSDEHSKTSNASIESDKKSQEQSMQDTPSKNLSNNAHYSKNAEENIDHSLGNNGNSFDECESKISENSEVLSESKISLPAVRPPSSKSTSRSLSARSDSNGLVLPPISPESTKSPKVKEELILPVLSPPRSTVVTPDAPIDHIVSIDKIIQTNDLNNDEEFQDSLNVTPELLDAPQRPDSLETSEIVDKSDSSGHISPLETLKDKLLEIEEVQKRIEGVLDDTKTNDDKNIEENKAGVESELASNIQNKLLEIQESEKRIEKILDSQSTTVDEPKTITTDIETKLKELEDAEKRIESIFINESDKEGSTQIDTETVNVVQKDNINPAHRTIDNTRDNCEEKDFEDRSNTNSNNGEKIILIPAENNRVLSPHSYILTEGSPYDIPDSVTTVIIPDRIPTPDSDTLNVELENGKIYSTLLTSKSLNVMQTEDFSKELEEEQTNSIHEAFGEAVDTVNIETSTVDAEYIRGIKANHDMIVPRQDLTLIKEEHDNEAEEVEIIDSEDEKVLKVVTSSLEEILEKDEVEYVSKEEVQAIAKSIYKETDDCSPEAAQTAEYESTDETKESSVTGGLVETTEVVENSLDIEEITARSAESTNEIKETSGTTDRSSLSFDPAVPFVPELNLDSLPDLTISSFNITDDEQKDGKNQSESKKSSSAEVSLDSGKTKENVSVDRKSLEEKFVNVLIEIDLDKNSLSSDIASDSPKNQEVHEDINEIVNDSRTILEKSEQTSNECVKDLREEYVEQLETEEYLKLEESINTSVVDKIHDANQITEETSKIVSENIQVESNENINIHDDMVADVTPELNVQIVETSKTEDTAPDDINKFVCDESNENKQIIQIASESQNNLLTHQSDFAESSSKELENGSSTIEQKWLGVIGNDQNSQLVESSRASSQCTTTRQLDSDDLSIKTNADETALQINQSQDTNIIPEEDLTITEKSSDNGFQVSDANTFKKEDIEHVVAALNEKKQYSICIPEMSTSKDLGSSSESSTFMSAATKIQAGVRGFLTRRRLQSTQHRSSTLDSVPSIQESFAVECPAQDTEASNVPGRSVPSASHLMPIAESASSTSESRARKKLRREDAVQRTTLSVENAFADNQVQHTGEFHDCIPLPVLDAAAILALKLARQRSQSDSGSGESPLVDAADTRPNVERLLGKILLEHAAAAIPGPSKLGPFVDVVLLPGDTETMLQSRYLNFITSVEDVANELFRDPDTPKGLVIEEITSLDEIKSNDAPPSELDEKTENEASDVKTEESPSPSRIPREAVDESIEEKTAGARGGSEAPEAEDVSSLVEVSISTSDLSMNIEEVLGLGEGEESSRKTNRPMARLQQASVDLLRSSNVSQESHFSDERTRSPVTMMQIAPTSVEEQSNKSEEEKNNGSAEVAEGDEPSTEAASTTVKEDNSTEEKEQESPNEKKSNDVNASAS